MRLSSVVGTQCCNHDGKINPVPSIASYCNMLELRKFGVFKTPFLQTNFLLFLGQNVLCQQNRRRTLLFDVAVPNFVVASNME